MKYVGKAFEYSLKSFRKYQKTKKSKGPKEPQDNYSIWARYDMDERRYARRKRAAEAYLELARKYAVENCEETLFSSEMEKNEPEQYGFSTRWGRLNAVPQLGYDCVNQLSYLTVAAAIWILDRIKEYNFVPFLNENGKIERDEYDYPKSRLAKLIEILPREEEIHDTDMPYLWDCVHSDALIRGVVTVIERRNDDCAGKKQRVDERKRPLLDSFTTEGIHRQNVPSRRRFEALLNLIPKEDMTDSAEQFEGLMWEWMGMYLSSVNEFLQKEDAIYLRLQKKYKELDALYEKTEKMAEDLQYGKSKSQRGSFGNPILTNGPIANPLMVNPLQGFPARSLIAPTGLVAGGSPLGSRSGSAADIVLRISELEKVCERTEKQLTDLHASEMEIFYNQEKLFSETEEAVCTRMNLVLEDEKAAARAADAFCGIAIQDPYSVCFGLLYLIDSGSDLPWLYFPALSVTKLAAVHLPWYDGYYDEEEDELWEMPVQFEEKCWDSEDPDVGSLSDAEYVRMRERLQWEKNHRKDTYPQSLRVPEIPDWYRLNLINEKETEDYGDRFSLARIVYAMTGAIMPRNLNRYEKILPKLSNFGIRGKKALPYEYIMLLLGEMQRQSQDWHEEVSEIKKQTSPAESDTNDSSSEPQHLKKQLEEMKRELATLKETAYSANRAFQEERRKNEKLREESEKERQELYALRELVFSRENGGGKDLVETSIDLPYMVRKRTVVFGGHDSWAKAIKPMLLGNIRFVPRSTKPSADLIRHADVIWIQTNSISHKEYYAIINVIRSNRIQVEYFQHSSAERCARELAEHDMEEQA